MAHIKRGGLVSSLAIGIVLALTLGAVGASADSISFNLTPANSGLNTGSGGCCTGPYASFTLNRTSTTTATVTLNSLTNGGFIYLIGNNQGFAVNVNGTATSSGFTASNSLAGFTPGPVSDGGSTSMDGFGTFSNSENFFDGFTSTATTASFTLTATGGTTWASAASVLKNNASGASVAYHGFACATSVAVPCSSTTGATSTGFATAVPEPTTISLLAALGGLIAFAAVRLRSQSAS